MSKRSLVRFSLVGLCLMAVMMLFFSTGVAEDSFTLELNIDFDQNAFFSKYDVDMYLDDNLVATLDHGVAYTGTLSVGNGTHYLSFYKHNSKTIKGVTSFEVNGETAFSCTIHAYNDEVSIRSEKVRSAAPSTTTSSSGQNDNQAPARSAPAENKNLTTITTKDGVTINVTRVYESKENGWNTPESGNVYVMIELDVHNNSRSSVTVSGMFDFEAYEDGYKVEYSAGADWMASGSLSGIAAGKKGRGEIGFEVRQGWQELEIHYKPNLFSSEEYVFTVNR